MANTCRNVLFVVFITPIYAHDMTSHTCRRRSYRPRDQCSVPVSRDYLLPLLEPGKVGTVTRRSLVSDRPHEVITVAVDPPLFEIPDFLSSSECEAIIEAAVDNGLRNATVMGRDKLLSGHGRVGQTTFLLNSQFPQIRERVAALTRIPLEVVFEGEGLQIGHYWPGGHYRDHFDSMWEPVREGERRKPCCHNIHGLYISDRCNLCRLATVVATRSFWKRVPMEPVSNAIFLLRPSKADDKLQHLRYLTVLMYLNDVEEGGETAFPDADLTGNTTGYFSNRPGFNDSDCSVKPLLVKPMKGKAVMWYNHHRDDKTGWLGPQNMRSKHGGCDVIHGEKWIANVWVNVAYYEDRNKPSIYAAKKWE